MKSKLYCKILAIGIIALFIGVGIHPAFAIDTKQSMVNKSSEEDFGCNQVDDRQFVVLEKQLNRLEVYSKLLLALLKHNPEIEEKSDELINEVISIKKRFEGLTIYRVPIICDILEPIIGYLWGIAYYYVSKIFNEDLPNITVYIYLAIAFIIMNIAEPFVILGEVFDCNIY